MKDSEGEILFCAVDHESCGLMLLLLLGRSMYLFLLSLSTSAVWTQSRRQGELKGKVSSFLRAFRFALCSVTSKRQRGEKVEQKQPRNTPPSSGSTTLFNFIYCLLLLKCFFDWSGAMCVYTANSFTFSCFFVSSGETSWGSKMELCALTSSKWMVWGKGIGLSLAILCKGNCRNYALSGYET